MGVAGIVLAAGGGSRYGQPKGLVRDGDGVPWVVRACDLLTRAGCTDVRVVVGASAAEVRRLVPQGVRVVEAADWATGLGASLRAGLESLADLDARTTAVLVTLVDLPGMPASVVQRVLAPETAAGTADGNSGHVRRDLALGDTADAAASTVAGNSGRVAGGLSGALRQAMYDGRPGHPVLIGRDAWPELPEQLAGDRGARPYLVAHGVTEVECGDLWSGDDVDRPEPPTPNPNG